MKKLIMLLTLAGLVVPATFAVAADTPKDDTKKVEKKKKNKKKKGETKKEEAPKGQ